jgi:uncharacterized membrane protein
VNRNQRAATVLFAVGMIALGVLGLVYGDFALQWQPVDASLPGRLLLAYVSAIVMLAGGIGLLFTRTAAASARVLFPYLLLWLLLKLRGIIAAPLMEGTWLGFGEIAVLASGGWVLFARATTLPEHAKLKFLTGDVGVRIAQLFFGFWLIPIGISHFMYVGQTVKLVPAWLPFRTGWAYLTGAGHIVAGVGVLFSIYPRLAARLEAAMIGVFTLLVWVPAVIARPGVRINWTATVISLAIAAGAWVVAERIEPKRAVHHG